MKTSELHTGSMLLLTATLITGGLASLLLFPMLKQQGVAMPRSSSNNSDELTRAAITQGQKFAEFYPTEFHTVSYPEEVAVQTPNQNTDLRNYFESARVQPAHAEIVAEPQSDPWRPQHRLPPTQFASTNDPFAPDHADHHAAPSISHQTTHTNSHDAFASTQTHAARETISRTIHSPQSTDSDALPGSTTLSGTTALPGTGSGSVYAPITVHPVTVNVDGSMFAQQMQAIQSRFEHLLQQQQMAKDSVAANEARRQNRRLRNEHNKSVETNEKLAQSNESIAQLEAEVSQLVVAFRELKTQTDIQLQALAHQADRTRVAEESIAAYRAALDAAERRLAESAAIRVARQPSHVAADYPRMSESSAGRVYLDESPATDFAAPAAPVPKAPVPPTPFEFPVQRPAPSPKAVQPASPKPNAEGTRFFQPEPEPVPQGKPFPDDGPSPELSTQQEFVPQDQNRYRLEITESDAESLPTLPSLEETGNDLSAEVRNDVSSMRSAFLSDQDQMTVPVPPIMDELDSADESFAELVSPLQALELVPSIEQPKELHSVPEDFEREIPRMDRGAPVAFEHVYRFKLTDVQDGKAVVPADGAVCVHCGRVHNGNGKQGTCDTPQAITTTAYVPQSTPRADGDQKAGSSNRPDYRNAARGTNRHVNRTQQPKPRAQPKRTTQNTQDDQPSLLHRMSSSLFNWSRSSVE